MIMLWFGCWLYNALGGNHEVWWGLPFFITFMLLVMAETIFEIGLCGVIIQEYVQKKPS